MRSVHFPACQRARIAEAGYCPYPSPAVWRAVFAFAHAIDTVRVAHSHFHACGGQGALLSLALSFCPAPSLSRLLPKSGLLDTFQFLHLRNATNKNCLSS